MKAERATPKVHEVVGVFDEPDALHAAIAELETRGFDRAEISLLADRGTIAARTGRAYGDVRRLEDDPEVPRTAHSAIESGGELRAGIVAICIGVAGLTAAAATALSGGTWFQVAAWTAGLTLVGALVGILLSSALVGRKRRAYVREQLARGGLPLWVRTGDEARDRRAIDILRRHAARDVHAHDIAA